LYSICAKLTERFEFFDNTRRISTGGSELLRLPFAALISRVSGVSESTISLVDSSKVVPLRQDLALIHESALVRIQKLTSHEGLIL
jgi:hypothetical protein